MKRVIYQLKDVSYTYNEDGKAILNCFNWKVNEKERWGVVGASGCGKTTLMYLLAGLKKPNKGEVLYRGKNASAPINHVSFIQQEYGLFRWKTVQQNLGFPLLLKKLSRSEIKQRVNYEIDRLGLNGMENRFPGQLSGGQRQRVAIGRALIDHPEVLLMDEPFSALDALTRESLQEEVLRISLETGVTVVLVTHSIEEAVYMCDHLLVYGKDTELPVVIDNVDTPHDRYNAIFVAQCAKVKALLVGGKNA